jgi:alpha-glucosidase
MQDVEIPPELVRDPQGIKSPGYGRDPVRTPMQWDTSPNAGFCPEDAEPWLPTTEDREVVNVAAQQADPRSMLSLVRRLVGLRRELPALTVGSYGPLEAGNPSVIAYLREHGEQRVLVALNFGAEQTVLHLPEAGDEGDVLCSTSLDRTGPLDLRKLALRPHEGILVSLESGV